MATVAAESLLAMQAAGSQGALATELDVGSNFHYVVHQATGMVSAQLEVGMAEALVRLRAHSFAAERPLAVVAADVVGRRVRRAWLAGVSVQHATPTPGHGVET